MHMYSNQSFVIPCPKKTKEEIIKNNVALEGVDATKALKEYDALALDQYMRLRNQCRSYGELKKKVEELGKEFRWHMGNDAARRIEKIMRDEIDRVLEIIPITDTFWGVKPQLRMSKGRCMI